MTQAVAIPGSLSQAGGGPGLPALFSPAFPGRAGRQGVNRLGKKESSDPKSGHSRGAALGSCTFAKRRRFKRWLPGRAHNTHRWYQLVLQREEHCMPTRAGRESVSDFQQDCCYSKSHATYQFAQSMKHLNCFNLIVNALCTLSLSKACQANQGPRPGMHTLRMHRLFGLFFF